MLKEFKEFAMRGNVIDLAVGIILGAGDPGVQGFSLVFGLDRKAKALDSNSNTLAPKLASNLKCTHPPAHCCGIPQIVAEFNRQIWP